MIQLSSDWKWLMETLGAWKALAIVACKCEMPFVLVSCLLISILWVVFMSLFFSPLWHRLEKLTSHLMFLCQWEEPQISTQISFGKGFFILFRSMWFQSNPRRGCGLHGTICHSLHTFELAIYKGVLDVTYSFPHTGEAQVKMYRMCVFQTDGPILSD